MKHYFVLVESAIDGWTGVEKVSAPTFQKAREEMEIRNDNEYNVINIIEGGKLVW